MLHVLTHPFPTRRSFDRVGGLEGQLTATLLFDEADEELVAPLIPLLARKAGRILANGWPTGVEVCRDGSRRSVSRHERQSHHIGRGAGDHAVPARSEEHTSELQSLMRTSYAVFCL